MRRLTNIISVLAATLLAAVSCEKADDTTVTKNIDPALAGEWHLVSDVAEGNDVGKGIDVYLIVNADFTFELYQKTGTLGIRYNLYTGEFFMDGEIFTGRYSDGKQLGRYTYTISGDELVLKTFNLLEEQIYTRTVIPSEIKENANFVTKSGTCTSAPIL